MLDTTIRPLIKPSDAKSWSSCKRRVWLDYKADFDFAPVEDPFEQLIIRQGMAHEQAVLQRLSHELAVHTATSRENTVRLIDERVPVIYQAQLEDEKEGLIGFPDFLILSRNGEYQAAEAKLSSSASKKEILVQLGVYRRMLKGQLPSIVFLGNGEQALVGDEANPVANQFVTEMNELLASSDEPSVRYSHSKCRACPYYTHCKPGFETKEELSLLYGINGRAAQGLENSRINTITQLADTDPTAIPNIPFLKGDEKKQRAVLQAKSHINGEVFSINQLSLPAGQWVHFDIENNPLTESGEKHVYLWGFLVPDSQGDWQEENFEYVWTDCEEEGEKGWIDFLGQIDHYRELYPDLILAHYSNYERSVIRSCARRYGMKKNETVTNLLGDESPLFDLRKPVLESLVLPVQSYGLKDICKHQDLVDFQWQDDASGAQWSVVQFNRFLSETDAQLRANLKAEILSYNRDDVTATRRLEQWLRANFIH